MCSLYLEVFGIATETVLGLFSAWGLSPVCTASTCCPCWEPAYCEQSESGGVAEKLLTSSSFFFLPKSAVYL